MDKECWEQRIFHFVTINKDYTRGEMLTQQTDNNYSQNITRFFKLVAIFTKNTKTHFVCL